MSDTGGASGAIDLERFLARDKAEVARALNLADDSRPASRAALFALFGKLPRVASHARVGITGPPGVGKSTLVGALSREWRGQDLGVGVVAVDPSSVRSGGALLGDRVRIAPDVPDAGFFVRSLATRGEAGGLARSAPASIRVLSSVYERTLVETVGVGQNETDVRDVVDTVVLVVQPGSGDALQFLKAGIMEVPDVLVVNKADHDDLARAAQAELRSALAALASASIGADAVPIFRTSARDGTGIGELRTWLDQRHASLVASGELSSLRRAQHLRIAERAFVRSYGEVGVEAMGGLDELRKRIEEAHATNRPLPALRYVAGE